MYNTYTNYILKSRKTRDIRSSEFSLFALGMFGSNLRLNRISLANFFCFILRRFFWKGSRCYDYQLVEEVFLSKAS